MAWRFRKSFSPLPGVRLTLSKGGISTSVGVGPFRLTAGQRGLNSTTHVAGLSYQTRLDGGTGGGARPLVTPTLPPNSEPPLSPDLPTTSNVPDLTDISSVGSGMLTTPGLAEFKRLLTEARREHHAIGQALVPARAKESTDSLQFSRWENGWLFRRLFKAKFQRLQTISEESVAVRAELEEQSNLSRLHTEIDLPANVMAEFSRLCDDFLQLTRAKKIWDTVAFRETDRVVERTSASRNVSRKPVTFRLGNCEIIDSQWKVPHLENANGGDIYLYPAFALYFVGAEGFALLEYRDVHIGLTAVEFIEQEPIPDDSRVVGQAWEKANKDGSPDRRFAGNRQIPVAQYAQLVLKSGTGLNEEYMVSNVEAARAFAHSWQRMLVAIDSQPK